MTAQKALAEALDIEVVDLHRHPDQPSADALLRGQPQEIVDLVLKLAVAIITPTNSTKGRQPRRPHFIPEWAERQNLIQKELANLSGADKGLVSKWYSGTTPGMEWQTKLAEVFGCDREGLFRHPDEDWLVRFFHDRTNDEVARMKSMLEAAFPSKRGQS